jgi:hypothetical protein
MRGGGEDAMNFDYKFTFSDGSEKDFNVKLDAETLNFIRPGNEPSPDWTKLNYCRCENCSLDEKEHEFCPVAVNLVDLIDFFKNLVSYDEVDVSIHAEGRMYSKHTSLQKGLSSLMGIYMVTSGCPVMERLKPMVRHHLPFATTEETTYRVLSMYLLAQYFLWKRGEEPDWDMDGLSNIYDNIRTLNKSFCERLSHVEFEDASVNAVVILDNFADMIRYAIDKDNLDKIEELFKAY